jgi:hypothetical protein
MVTNPENVEEAMRQYRELRAKNEPKQDDPIWVERSVKAPGSAQYCMHELKFTTVIPADEKTSQRIRDLRKLWDFECQEFEKQHVRPQNGSQTPQKPTLPYGITQIEWRPNQYGPGEYTRTDQPETVELRKTLENISKPIEIEGQSYSLNIARTYVYRKPVEAKP